MKDHSFSELLELAGFGPFEPPPASLKTALAPAWFAAYTISDDDISNLFTEFEGFDRYAEAIVGAKEHYGNGGCGSLEETEYAPDVLAWHGKSYRKIGVRGQGDSSPDCPECGEGSEAEAPDPNCETCGGEGWISLPGVEFVLYQMIETADDGEQE